MLLYIDDNKTVGDLQEKFNECFPYLKIEFYNMMHKWGKSSFKDNKIDPVSRVGSIRKNHNSGTLEIKSWYKTGKVEQDLRHDYGLYVQIFFLQNNEWIQSVSSDDVTLAQLNHSLLPG
jgi:hypothetical protein